MSVVASRIALEQYGLSQSQGRATSTGFFKLSMLGAEGSPALILHCHTPLYRSGAAKKTGPVTTF
jgi:hypothetical protein